MKKFIFLIIILALSGGGYYYYTQNNDQVSTTSYEYINIEKGNIKKIVSATGKIIPTSTLILSSEISGKIVDVDKDYNEVISKGDVLATFDQNPFLLSVKETETSVSISKSKLKQKMASLEKAKSELNNSISNKAGSISKFNDFTLFLEKLKLEKINDKTSLVLDSIKELDNYKYLNINLLKKSLFTLINNISNSKGIKKDISLIDNTKDLLNYIERKIIWT